MTKQVASLKGKDESSGDSPSSSARLPGVLLANKSDLKERRTVPPKAGSDLAGRLGLMYFECSCRDHTGVEEPFYFLANEFHKLHQEGAELMASMAA